MSDEPRVDGANPAQIRTRLQSSRPETTARAFSDALKGVPKNVLQLGWLSGAPRVSKAIAWSTAMDSGKSRVWVMLAGIFLRLPLPYLHAVKIVLAASYLYLPARDLNFVFVGADSHEVAKSDTARCGWRRHNFGRRRCRIGHLVR